MRRIILSADRALSFLNYISSMKNVMRQGFSVLTPLFLFVVLFSFPSCKKKITGCTEPASANYNPDATDEDGSCDTLAIGASFGGGQILYYLTPSDAGYDPNHRHGLIIADTCLSVSPAWNNGADISTGTYSKAIGSGAGNTSRIVSVYEFGNYAARVCSDLFMNGYSDWYLPSYDELYLAYLNKKNLHGKLIGSFYWTSSESTASKAWGIVFNTNGISGFNTVKSDQGTIWPMRSF